MERNNSGAHIQSPVGRLRGIRFRETRYKVGPSLFRELEAVQDEESRPKLDRSHAPAVEKFSEDGIRCRRQETNQSQNGTSFWF